MVSEGDIGTPGRRLDDAGSTRAAVRADTHLVSYDMACEDGQTMPRSDAYFRGLADQAVSAAGFVEPPVELERIAAYLAVPIVDVTLPTWFTAALIHQDGLPTIVLNTRKEPLTRQTALGHELGHLLILMDDVTASYPKDSQREHREAELIGDELVLPEPLVREQAQKWFNDFRYLARLFAVSENRMLDRMQRSGIIRKRGIVWDY